MYWLICWGLLVLVFACAMCACVRDQCMCVCAYVCVGMYFMTCGGGGLCVCVVCV